jgi:hypothetical protein
MMYYISVAILLPLVALAQKLPVAQLQSNGSIYSTMPEVPPDSILVRPIVPAITNEGISTAQQCAPVHIIAGRGSGEAPGEGTIASLSKLLKQKIPGATSQALDYPAKMPYSGSIPVGVTHLKEAIAKYTNSCPTGKLVVLGYSRA